MQLRGDTILWSRCTDKHEVRGYVHECGLDDTLIPEIGVWDRPEDVDWESLPNRFVAKTTNGSGDVMIVKDKRMVDRECFNEYFRKELAHQWEVGHYSNIKHRLCIEEMMDNDPVSRKYSASLIDYKIWCFNGKPHYVWTCCNRTKKGVEVMTYDMDWNAHPEWSVFDSEYRHGVVIPKPKNVDYMMDVAAKLSKPFPVVRCDLYNLDGKVYFGELTFTSLGGLMNFYTDDFLLQCGKLIDIKYKPENSEQMLIREGKMLD
jgi:hypothetical protein